MTDHPINDFVPPEMRVFAERSAEQAKKAFDEWMSAAQRAVSTFEGQATSAHASALEMQRKVVGFSERNMSASLEFAQKLMGAPSADDAMRLHAEYVKAQMKALSEQAAELAKHATKPAPQGSTPRR